jgi:type 1 glutamine amidotransferase
VQQKFGYLDCAKQSKMLFVEFVFSWTFFKQSFHRNMKQRITLFAFLLGLSAMVLAGCASSRAASAPPRVLVFTKTAGFVHDAIPSGVAALQKMAGENNWIVDTTSDGALFTNENLRNYKAVIFLSTTGNVLNEPQQAAFENYVQNGGGFVGVHAAADTEYDWPFYNKVVGAYFLSHPKQQNAVIQIKDKAHSATSFLPERWERFDEWYNYKSISPDIKVLATLDETTYEGGKNGKDHPIAWYNTIGKGRAFYTGLGHTKESYAEPLFLRHLRGGILYVLSREGEKN